MGMETTGQPAEMTPEQFEDAWNQEAATRAGDDPPPDTATKEDQQPAAQTEAKQDPEPATAATPAPPAPLSDAERLARMEATIASLGLDVKTVVGRVGSIQREMTQAETARKAVQDAPSKAAIADANKSLPKWEQLKADFPEWAEAMEEKLASQSQATPAPAPQAVDSEAIRASIKRELQLDLISEKYPDWQAVSQTQEFQRWFNAQAPEFRQKAESERGADVIHVMDKFNEAKTKSVTDIRQNRQDKLSAAAGVAPTGRTPPREKEDSELTAEEIWAQEARRRDAKRKA